MIKNQSGLDLSNEIRFRLERSIIHRQKLKLLFSVIRVIIITSNFYRERLPWSPSCETSRNILNARFVSKPTTNPKLYHVYTHFAVSVWRIMQEPATKKESSVVQSAKRKSICPKITASIVSRPVFSTKVCWASLPFDAVAMKVKWLVLNVEKPTSRCTTALTVDGLCAPDCYNAHQMLQASFGDHNVTPVKEFKTENYEALLKRLPFCSKKFHEKHVTEFFCFSCNDCVCLRCTATEHKSHEVEVLDKAAHDEKPRSRCWNDQGNDKRA